MGKELVPEGLNPKLREAVRLYTDPLMPTFGNKTASCIEAGYKDHNALSSEAAKNEIARIERQRADQGAKVAEYLGNYAFDAARELVRQLSAGADLRVEDPTDLLRERTDEEIAEMLSSALATSSADERLDVSDIAEAMEGDRMARAELLIKHNRVALQGAKERRAALELLLRYHLGHPEHKHRHIHDQDTDPLDLGDLSDEDLQRLGEFVHDAIDERKEAGPGNGTDPQEIVEAEYEVEG